MSRITRRTLHRGLLAAGGTLLAALVSRKFLLPAADAQQDVPPPPFQGLDALKTHKPTPLPPLSFVDGTGASRTLDQYKGHGLVLNLWATWCVPCVTELPALDALARTLQPSGAQVLTVSVDRGGADQVRPFFAAHGIRSLPILLDPHSAVLSTLRLDGIPTTLLVNRNGLEVARLQGPIDWSAPDTLALVNRLLA